MANATCPSIGKGNLQRVFAVIEDVPGVLQRPVASGLILPSGPGEINQAPEYTDSEELSESLNPIYQFQNAFEPGEVTLNMLLRTRPDAAPQGDALLRALMGSVQTAGSATAALTEGITASSTSLTVDGLDGGDLPPRGVVTIGEESILYTALTGPTDDTWTLSGLTRGYAGTTAADHAADDTVTLASRVYMQEVCRPTVSVWMQFDHFLAFMSGCVVTEASFPLSREGGQAVNFSLQGRRMGWAGTGAIVSASGNTVTMEAGGTDAYAVGAIIRNKTRGDDNAGAGYTVTAINKDANTLTLSAAPSGWASGDLLVPWLPEAQPIGTPVESKTAKVYVNTSLGHRREGELTIGTPAEFAAEIGDEYPGEAADGRREITLSGGLYFRREDALEFGRGYRGQRLPMAVVFGDADGSRLSACMPRCRFGVPTISTDGEFLVLEQDGTALGIISRRNGESSLYLVLE